MVEFQRHPGNHSPRGALQELSTNIYSSSSTDSPRNLDFISFQDETESSLSLDIGSFMSKTGQQVEDCSCAESSALEHSDYRRLANQEGRDSRLFDDEYEIPMDDPSDSINTTAELIEHPQKTHVGPWILGKTLGTGSTGRVRLVRHVVTKQLGAAKIMSKQPVQGPDTGTVDGKPKQKWTNPMEREVIIMKMVRHPNIVRMYDVWEGHHELYLVLEYVDGGDLFDYMIRRGSLPEPEAVSIFVQILKAVEYCHHFNICHRDLKLENILLDKNNGVKIADFGFAALQPPGCQLARSCGTPHYAAPEVIGGGEYNGPPADIWSCGIILFALLNGTVPFDDDDHMAVLQKVRIGTYTMPQHMSAEAKNLIHRILTVNPDQRITMEDIWKHPLVTHYLNEAEIAARKQQASFKTIAHPVECVEEIDRTILESMQSLWPCVTDINVLKAALLSREPNQEKVFYALLERYKDVNEEYYSGKLASQTKSLKKFLSSKKGKLLRSKTSATRSNAQRRASIEAGDEEEEHAATQLLDQIQEGEEECEDPSKPFRGKLVMEDINDGDDNWQDYSVRADPLVKGKGALNDNHVFRDETSIYFGESEQEDESKIHLQCDIPPKEKRKSRPKSWVSPASRRRSAVFQKATNKARPFPTLDEEDDRLDEDIFSEDSTFEGSPRQEIMGRKEGAARRRKNRSSIGSSYTGAVIGVAMVIPVRRKANLRVEDEDVRKASKELSEFCEVAFRTGSPLKRTSPQTLPLITVMNETAEDLETPENLHPKQHYFESDVNSSLQSYSVIDNIADDTADADDEQVDNNKFQLLQPNQRAVSETTQGVTMRGPISSAHNRPTYQGHHQQTINSRKVSHRDLLQGTGTESSRSNSGFLEIPHQEVPLGNASHARAHSPAPSALIRDHEVYQSVRAGSPYVEHFRQESTRLDGNCNDVNAQKKRNIFSKLGSKLGSKLFDKKPDTANLVTEYTIKEKAPGLWATLTSKMAFTATKPAPEPESFPAPGNTLFRLWNREYRKDPETAHPGVHPLTDNSTWDSNDGQDGPIQYTRPDWFKRVLNMKPSSHIICFKTSAVATHHKILEILDEWNWKDLGVVDIKANKREGLISARVARRNAINVRPISFFIQVRSYENDPQAGKSVVRIIQEKGAASSLRRVVQEIVKICRRSGILVDNPLEVTYMECSSNFLG